MECSTGISLIWGGGVLSHAIHWEMWVWAGVGLSSGVKWGEEVEGIEGLR